MRKGKGVKEGRKEKGRRMKGEKKYEKVGRGMKKVEGVKGYDIDCNTCLHQSSAFVTI